LLTDLSYKYIIDLLVRADAEACRQFTNMSTWKKGFTCVFLIAVGPLYIYNAKLDVTSSNDDYRATPFVFLLGIIVYSIASSNKK